MTFIREDRASFFKGRGEDSREIANSFLYTPGIQFINLYKLRDILVARHRDEIKRRESEKIGRIAREMAVKDPNKSSNNNLL